MQQDPETPSNGSPHSRLEDLVARGVAWMVGVSCRHAWLVTIAVLAATAGILVYAGQNLGIHGDTESLFSPDLPFKQREHRYLEVFPAQNDNLFIVVDATTPERAGEAAAALAARMQAMPERFHDVYLPGGGEFFERHAFLYLKTEELEKLADQLAEVQPYIAELALDGSLRGLASMTARGVRAVRDGDIGGERLASIFQHMDEAVRARSDGRHYELSWAEVLASADFPGDPRRRFLMAQPVLDRNDLQPGKRAILEVRRVAEELGLTPGSGVQVRITGDVALSYEEMEVVRGQAASSAIGSIVLVALLLVHSLRSVRLFLATLLLLLVGLVWTAGFATLSVGRLNLISSSFAVIFIGLGVDFGIHLCLRYNELLSQVRSHTHAMRGAAYDVGTSIVLGGATTAIGFLAFIGTGFVGVAELGIISAGGLVVSVFLTFTLLPALMSLRPRPADGVDRSEAGWSGARLSALPIRHPRFVRTAALALGVGSILLLPLARFDNNPLNVRDPSSESVRTFNDLLEKGGTSPWTLDGVAPDLATAEAIAQRVRGLDVVDRVVTVADYIPSDQDEKLDIIGDVRLFMAPTPGPGGLPEPATQQEQIDALKQLEAEIGALVASGAPPALAAPSQRLHESLGAYLAKLASDQLPVSSVGDLEASLMGTLREQLRILDAALTAGHVTLQNLPGALRERMITADGRVRVQIFPRYDIGDRKNLAAFVDQVREVMPEVAGSAAEVLESGRAVVRSLQQALLGAVVAITIVLLLVWRRIDDTALVLIPLFLAAALTVATTVLFDIPFNFADVIVLPLLLGMGVDSCVHLIHRARFPIAHDQGILGTSTARAVFYSALTSIFGFGTMGFASHVGLATLGQMLTLGVTYSMLCNMVVLPALISLRSERQRRIAGPSAPAQADGA
jgi:hypothetical protein